MKYPASKEIIRVYELICNYLKIAVGSGQGQSYDFEINEFCTYYKLNSSLVYSAMKVLESDAYFQSTESVYMPSRMKILVSYHELYEWQLRNEDVDALFKLLLRSYGGLFDFYTGIWEFEIARRLHKPEKWVKEQLMKLRQIEIIDYIPRNSKPQLVFLENRFSSIHITDERIAFLRKRHLEKLEHMNRYIRNQKYCRSKLLVSYFGEDNAPDCGHCDVCLNRKKPVKNNYDTHLKKLRTFIDTGTFRTRDLKTLVSSDASEEYLSILRQLSDRGLLKEDREGYWKWAEKKG
jgi:ATP-dependent DNA helicase RecQ